MTAIVLSMGTKFVNKEEIVSGTRSEDSVTVSFLTASVHRKMYSLCLMYLFLLFVKKCVLVRLFVCASAPAIDIFIECY